MAPADYAPKQVLEIECRNPFDDAAQIVEHIGPLIDSWMSIPNDLMSDLAYASPVFVSRMNTLIRALGTESK